MAVTPIAITSLVNSTPLALPAYTAVTAIADGATISMAGIQISDCWLGLKISGSALSASAVSIKAGDNPPAFRAGLGDVLIALSGSVADGEYLVSLGDSARILQSNQTIELTFDVGVITDANARVIKLPR